MAKLLNMRFYLINDFFDYVNKNVEKIYKFDEEVITEDDNKISINKSCGCFAG